MCMMLHSNSKLPWSRKVEISKPCMHLFTLCGLKEISSDKICFKMFNNHQWNYLSALDDLLKSILIDKQGEENHKNLQNTLNPVW